ncbi:hypothetical protein B7P43_G09336 [Cryptotermes secundus]|uniref:Uncharacterized protein n=1 Tax=Cryptotermes secundus TaxID=105785 RepID=A0A2J7QTC6_9NEOP|nr:hypothetical protein B7P43_G09336 [Cryptotermes secundus]
MIKSRRMRWAGHAVHMGTRFFSPICATCPAHLIVDLMILIILGEEYNFLKPPVTSSLFGQNILLNTLFSNTLSLCFSLNVRDQVSDPYRTTGKFDIDSILSNRQQQRKYTQRHNRSLWSRCKGEEGPPLIQVHTVLQ